LEVFVLVKTAGLKLTGQTTAFIHYRIFISGCVRIANQNGVQKQGDRSLKRDQSGERFRGSSLTELSKPGRTFGDAAFLLHQFNLI
jgi:hypothetical protein